VLIMHTLRQQKDWSALNAHYRRLVDRSSWCTLLLAHSPQQLPHGWTHTVLLPTVEMHTELIDKRGAPWAASNRAELAELAHEEYSSFSELDMLLHHALSDARNSMGLPRSCLGCRTHQAISELQHVQAMSKTAPTEVRAFLASCTYSITPPPPDWPGTLPAAQLLQANTTGLGISSIRMTLPMIDAETPLSEAEQACVMHNSQLEEHTVVAWLLWCRLAPLEVLQCTHNQLVSKDIIALGTVAPALDALRLLDDDAPADDVALLLALRKFGTLVGRDIGDADWTQERYRSSAPYAYREAFVGSARYRDLFSKHTRLVIARTIRNTYDKRMPSIEEWWKGRFTSTSSGSSSNRHSVDNQKTDLHTSADRPNKRVVYAYLPDDAPISMLRRPPHILARASVKPEPGRKHRALYAACDCSSIIASYASHGLESAMRWGGMVAKQKPEDVLEWLELHNMSQKTGGTWLSLDYTDFNKEHRTWELAAINFELAREWQKHPLGTARTEKATTAYWTAQSHYNRLVTHKDEQWAPEHGLFSGHRDTARDNTLLHKIYQSMQLDVLQGLFEASNPLIGTFMCGDDEDTLLKNKRMAMAYYGVGVAMGWHFNPKKQMLSQKRHEFLQYMCNGSGAVTQPLIPNVVAFVNGNWYKNPLLDPVSMGESILAMGTEMVCRGAPPVPVAGYVTRCARSWYRWLYGQNVRWDQLLSSRLQLAYGVQPYSSQDIVEQDPNPKLLPTIHSHNPPALQTLIKKWWPLFSTLEPTERQRIINGLKEDTLRSWYTAAWNQKPTLPPLPTGHEPRLQITLPMPAQSTEAWFSGMHALAGGESLSKSQLAGLLGMPLALLQAIDLQTLNSLGNPTVSGYLNLPLDDIAPNTSKALAERYSGTLPWLR